MPSPTRVRKSAYRFSATHFSVIILPNRKRRMPIERPPFLRRISQDAFGRTAYDVMNRLFEIHNDFGRFFDERVYKRELARRLPSARLEVPILLTFDSFRKNLFLDVLVGDGALFECKCAETIAPRHRSQTLNYLMLADFGHAKLVNLRPEHVEHEFVNTTLRHADRLQFEISTLSWDDGVEEARRFRELLTAVLRDWGTGLDLLLYDQVLTHCFGGEDRVLTDVEVRNAGVSLGFQRMHSIAPRIAFKLTALDAREEVFASHARRLLSYTNIDAILWANIRQHKVTFETLKRI
jgi:GxxExxY protein